jgi:hypothetical protein
MMKKRTNREITEISIKVLARRGKHLLNRIAINGLRQPVDHDNNEKKAIDHISYQLQDILSPKLEEQRVFWVDFFRERFDVREDEMSDQAILLVVQDMYDAIADQTWQYYQNHE